MAKKKVETPAEVIPVPVGFRIVEMAIENIKKVSFAHFKPEGDMIFVTGANGSGKSSVLDSIEWAITGTTNTPSQPIKKGKNSGKIVIDLGEFVLTRLFTRVDPEKSETGRTYFSKLILEGKNREIYRSPQQLLDGFMSKFSFDPLAFIRMDDKKQIEALRGLITFDVDLDAIEAEKQAAYTSRRDAGRDVERVAALLKATPEPIEGLPEKPIETAELMAKIESAANHNNIIAARKQEQQRKVETIATIDSRIGSNKAQIDRLREQIDELAAAIQTQVEARLRLEVEAAAITFDEPLDIAVLSAELQQAYRTNESIRQRNAYTSIQSRLAEVEADWKAQDDIVKAKEQERADAIARATVPVPGLSVGDGEVMFEDLPFSQASNAQQIVVSTKLAMASNPKLRVLRIKDGSLLDDKSLDLIASTTKAANYQIWIERIEGGNGGVAVVMEEGEIAGAVKA